jgi:hypothetical protein
VESFGISKYTTSAVEAFNTYYIWILKFWYVYIFIYLFIYLFHIHESLYMI